jgi:hypothetical protein
VPLFQAALELRSDSPADAVVPADGREGIYIGTSLGTVTGKRLSGVIRASFYSGDCLYPLARAGQLVPDGLHLCTVNPGMIIDTRDGARIRVDGKGYGLRDAGHYQVGAALVFATEAPRYSWLTRTLAVLEGEFDERTGRSSWCVYLPNDRARPRY